MELQIRQTDLSEIYFINGKHFKISPVFFCIYYVKFKSLELSILVSKLYELLFSYNIIVYF